MKRHEKVLENFSIGLLIFAGLLGMFVVLLDFVGEDFVTGPWRWLKGPETIILLIVASLALALGLERFVRFQQINRQLSGLERALEQAIGGRLIEDFEDLYDTAARMVLDARDHIRVSSLNLGQPRTYVLTGRADASKRYDEALVDSLQRSLRRPRPIKTDIVLGTDFDKTTDTVHERAEKRLGGFEEAGVKDLVSLYVNDISWGVDFLVVDDSHTLISFPITRGVRQLRFAIAYRDQPKVAQDIAEWYDEFLLRGSYTYEEFTKKYPPETIHKG